MEYRLVPGYLESIEEIGC